MKKILFIIGLLILTLTGCEQSKNLPDLTGKSESDVIETIEKLGIEYNIVYEASDTVEHGMFIKYLNYTAGTSLNGISSITIYIADNGVLLPNLEEKSESEVITTLDNLGIEYEIRYENRFSNEDYEFSSYQSYNSGDRFPNDETLIVYITWNGSFLPDLEGMIESQIVDALEYEFIYNYEFEYIIDDAYQEDTFAGYKDLKAGDPASTEGVIVIQLYKNTFTDAEESLFISKYLEDGSNDAIEIYNPTEVEIDLSDFHIAIFANGSYDATYTINLDGTLLPGNTYIVSYRGASENIKSKANKTSTQLVFDGNDTVQLRYKNNTAIDSIYEIGETLFIMQKEMFIRLEDTQKGNLTFNVFEWVAFVPGYVESLGIFPIDIPETFEINMELAKYDYGTDVTGGMRLVTLDYINDGDTAAFSPGLTGDQRVRFLGVDTPETYPVEDPWGPEAKAFTTGKLNNATTIYVQSDPYLGYKDTYDRRLGYVWVDGVMINYELVKNGFSYNYLSSDTKLVYGNRYLYRWFQDAERFANENGLGIHS